MANKDLITSARANYNLVGLSPAYNTLTALITAASDAIEKYCKRRFVTQAYDELYDGKGQRRLQLRQYPIQKVTSVRYRPVTVLKVINNNTTQNQQARVEIQSTGLQCWRMASGVATTETLLTWTAYPTLSTLATAITALGNGWQGTYVGDSNDYGSWPSADLYISGSYGDPLEGAGIQQSQGNLTARGQYAELKMHTYELAGYQWDARGWLLRAIPYTDPELQHPEDLVWPSGINNLRIQYTAGYTTVPEAVQEACAEWVAIMVYQTQRDPQLQHSVSAGTGSGYEALTLGEPPSKVKSLLSPYKRYSVSSEQG